MSFLPPSFNAVLTDSAKLQCLNALLPVFETWSVLLLSDLPTPTQQQTIWTVTECEFAGYLRQPVTNASAAEMSSDGHAYSEADAVLFFNTGLTPVTVKGWGYAFNYTASSLKASGVFDPWQTIEPGNSLALIPLLDDTSWSPCPPCVCGTRAGMQLGDRSVGPPNAVRAGVRLADRSSGPPNAVRSGFRLGDRSLGPPAVIRSGFRLGDRSSPHPVGNRASFVLSDRGLGPPFVHRAGLVLGDRGLGPPHAARSGVRLGDRSAGPPNVIRSGLRADDRSLGPPHVARSGLRLSDRSLYGEHVVRSGLRLGDRSQGPPAVIRSGLRIGDRSTGPPYVDRSGLILSDRSGEGSLPYLGCSLCPGGSAFVWGFASNPSFTGTWSPLAAGWNMGIVSGCTWGASGSGVMMSLSQTSSGVWTWSATIGSAVITYVISSGGTCFGPNVFSFSTQAGGLGTFPATLTMTLIS